MKVSQIYEIMNTITSELLGESAVVNEDLSNVVDLGNQFSSVVGLDKYVKALVDHIGKMIFVNRVYSGRIPSVLMDGWEYGSILEKISMDLPDCTENESWELENGSSYDPNIFYQPKISVKFYNQKTTFEVPISITERQVKSAFDNATQLNSFISMIYTAVQNSITVKTDALIMRTINVAMAETIYSDNTDAKYDNDSGNRAVNLLYLYNQKFNAKLSTDSALVTPAFIKFASYMMGLYADRLGVMSTLFNVGNKERFTPKDRLHFVLLSEFKNAASAYLESDTFHDEFVRLPDAETVPYWQGSGLNYEFNSTSAINVKTANNHTVSLTGVLGVMFDRDALGVCNKDPRVTSNYNPKAEFYNNWYKQDASYFVDTNENIVVFYIA